MALRQRVRVHGRSAGRKIMQRAASVRASVGKTSEAGGAGRRAMGLAWPVGLLLLANQPLNVGASSKWSKVDFAKVLDQPSYRVLAEGGTEPPFTSTLDKEYSSGAFYCKACSNPLYSSSDKFNSRTGWPSFTQPISKSSVNYSIQPLYLAGDLSCREVHCAQCSGHLGHTFGAFLCCLDAI